MIDLVPSTLVYLAAALCGVFAGLLHIGLTWQSAASTVRTGSLLPCAVGFALRLALLTAFGAALIVAELESTTTIIPIVAFLGVRWLCVSRTTARMSRPLKDAP